MPKSQQMSYAHLVEESRTANDTRSLRKLERIGPPTFDGMEKIGTFFKLWRSTNALAIVTGREARCSRQAFRYETCTTLQKGLFRCSRCAPIKRCCPQIWLHSEPAFRFPCFYSKERSMSAHRLSSPSAIFEQIHAPHKEFMEFEDNGHFVVLSAPDRFLSELVFRVRPFALRAG